MLTVIVPWRAQPSRLAALDLVVEWYSRNLPDAKIQTVDTDDAIFNLARCRNDGVRGISDPGQVVVINDADTIPEVESLRHAIRGASTSGLVHLPYTRYHWLGSAGTSAFTSGTPLAESPYELVNGACSGVYVTTPATWLSHGGQDERFRGWGFEDAAWYLAHSTLLGAEPIRNAGRVYALHHTAELRAGAQYEANAALMQGYRDAAGDAEAMRRLVFSAV